MPQKTGWAKALLSHPKLLVLDTETTDLNGYILQLAVLRARDGEALLDTLVNPLAEITIGAQRVHGITAEMAAAGPTFADIEPQLRELLHGRPVAIYNAEFDTGILYNELLRLAEVRKPPEGASEWVNQWMSDVWWVDVMHPYSQWVDEPGHTGYRWQKLPGGDHTAIGDCRATLAVLKRMADIQISIDPDDDYTYYGPLLRGVSAAPVSAKLAQTQKLLMAYRVLLTSSLVTCAHLADVAPQEYSPEYFANLMSIGVYGGGFAAEGVDGSTLDIVCDQLRLPRFQLEGAHRG
jgi:DNA polymerase-3 subunit epsilon